MWVDIKGYDGYYQVNEFGKVKSLEREVKTRDNKIRKIFGKLMKSQVSWKGYEVICLSKNSYIKKYFVHRLVADAFIGKIPDNHEVNHIDENKLNNHCSNLEYVTSSQNKQHGTCIKRSAENTKKKVKSTNIKTGLVNFYNSATDAQKESNNFYKARSISSVCNKRRKTHKGCYWEFANEVIK